MKCRCKKEMVLLIGDEYIEMYCCRHCGLFAIKNIECLESISFIEEVDRDKILYCLGHRGLVIDNSRPCCPDCKLVNATEYIKQLERKIGDIFEGGGCYE